MPNYKTHAVAGTLSGLGVTFYDYQKRKINDPNTGCGLRDVHAEIALAIHILRVGGISL